MASKTVEPGAAERHDPAVHTLVRASGSGLVTGADADALYECFRDFGGWSRWLPEVPFELQGGGRGTEVGALRAVVFARGDKWLLERLDALDDNARRCTYSGVNYGVTAAGEAPYPLSASPFPGGLFVDYSSTVTVHAVTVPAAPRAAFMTWTGEVWCKPEHAGALRDFLTAFYEGNVVKLNAYFAR